MKDKAKTTDMKFGFLKVRNTTKWQFWGGNDDKSWDLGVPDETRGVDMTPMGFRNRHANCDPFPPIIPIHRLFHQNKQIQLSNCGTNGRSDQY